MKKKYTRVEFAEKIGVSRVTLYNWEQKGLLTPRRTISGLPYYTDADVEHVNNFDTEEHEHEPKEE